MCGVNKLFPFNCFFEKRSSEIKVQEDTILLKIAACIPVIGSFISLIQFNSLDRELKNLTLPEEFRPEGVKGAIISKDADIEQKKEACKQADLLEDIQKDYVRAALISHTLTTALVVYAVAINVIPFIFGAIIVGGYGLASLTFALYLYVNSEKSHYTTSFQLMS